MRSIKSFPLVDNLPGLDSFATECVTSRSVAQYIYEGLVSNQFVQLQYIGKSGLEEHLWQYLYVSEIYINRLRSENKYSECKNHKLYSIY